MAKHNQIGHYGEALACIYIEKLGFEILHLNWRHKNWEIDIIARKQEKLHFIEVKTKSHNKNGYPETQVGIIKLQRLINAAEEYLHLNPYWERISFDILAITLYPLVEYYFIEDVYL